MTFKIEGYEKQFTVKELSVKQIISLMQDDVLLSNQNLDDFRKELDVRVLPMGVNATTEELLEMTPSELMIIFEKFKEANDAFFVTARTSGVMNGLEDILDQVKKAIIEDFSKWFALSSKQDIETP